VLVLTGDRQNPLLFSCLYFICNNIWDCVESGRFVRVAVACIWSGILRILVFIPIPIPLFSQGNLILLQSLLHGGQSTGDTMCDAFVLP
jgi:hypothetical protein